MTIIKTVRWIVPAVSLLMVVGGAAVALRTTAGARPARVPATPKDLIALNQARETLRNMGSLHVRASAYLSIEKPSGTVTGSGSFEYWELGDKYRIDSRLDPQLGLKRGTSIAYDGVRFAYYDNGQDNLTYSSADTRNNPSVLPNPVLLMFDFLALGSQDGCGNCRLRLTDLDDEARWSEAMGSFWVGSGGSIETARYGSKSHKQIHYQVEVSSDGQQVVKIERQDEKSGGSSVVEFGLHDSSGLPHYITVTSTSAAGTLYAQFSLEAIEPAVGADDSVFNIESTGIRTVWDSDTSTFLRTPGWSRPVTLTEILELCRAKSGRGGGLPK